MIRQSVFQLEGFGANLESESLLNLQNLSQKVQIYLAAERLRVAVLNFLVVHQALLVDRGIPAHITEVPHLAMDRHVLAQTNFILQPLLADRALDLELVVHVGGQVVSEIALAQKVLRADFAGEFFLQVDLRVDRVDVRRQSAGCAELPFANLAAERGSLFLGQVRD